MMDWGDANLGLVSVGQHDHSIKRHWVLPSSKNPSNDIKHITHTQGVLAKNYGNVKKGDLVKII